MKIASRASKHEVLLTIKIEVNLLFRSIQVAGQAYLGDAKLTMDQNASVRKKCDTLVTLCQSCNPSFIFVCFAEQHTTQKRSKRGHKTRKTEQETKNINRIKCENVEAAMVLNQTDRHRQTEPQNHQQNRRSFFSQSPTPP